MHYLRMAARRARTRGCRIAALAAVAASLSGCADQRPRDPKAAPTRTAVAIASPQTHDAPRPTSGPPPAGVQTVRLRHRSVAVHEDPGGRRVGRIGARTPYGSDARLWVRARRGQWLKVAALDTPDGVGWIARRHTSSAPRALRRVVIDRSERRLTVIGGGRTWSTRVVVGAATSPTPLGAYQVTDRLPGERFGGVYGRWVFVLSAYGSPSRNSRLAVHGVPPAARSLTGSAGCVRVPARALRRLAREIRSGTPVRIRP